MQRGDQLLGTLAVIVSFLPAASVMLAVGLVAWRSRRPQRLARRRQLRDEALLNSAVADLRVTRSILDEPFGRHP